MSVSRLLISVLAVLALAGCGRPETGYRIRAGSLLAEVAPIERGDVLKIGMWGESGMTRQLKVGPDGRISYHLATEVMAAGRTAEELKAEIVNILKPHFRDPQVFVSVVEPAREGYVSITSGVRRPGCYAIAKGTRLLDLIERAGGFVAGVNLGDVFILRGDKFLDVDFEKLCGGKPASAREVARNNVLLLPGDRIYVPEAVRLDNKVFVVGAVPRPRVIRFRKEISFLEALVTAGGLTEKAWGRKCFIVRGRMKGPKIIPVEARLVRTGRIADVRLQAGDVIFVPRTPLAKAADVARQLDVVFGGLTEAERASDARAFDR